MDEKKVLEEDLQEKERVRIYESDLTPKEKRAMEAEKLKGMTFRQKADYIWTYYKYVFALLGVGVVLIYIGVIVYHNSQQKELLSVAIVDAQSGPQTDKTELEQDLLAYIGTGDEKEIITIDTNGSSGSAAASVMKMNVIMSEKGTDVIICGKELYEDYEGDSFMDWRDVLKEDYERYEAYMEDGRLRIDTSEKWNQYQMVEYSPVYLAVSFGSERTEQAKKLLEYLFFE